MMLTVLALAFVILADLINIAPSRTRMPVITAGDPVLSLSKQRLDSDGLDKVRLTISNADCPCELYVNGAQVATVVSGDEISAEIHFGRATIWIHDVTNSKVSNPVEIDIARKDPR